LLSRFSPKNSRGREIDKALPRVPPFSSSLCSTHTFRRTRERSETLFGLHTYPPPLLCNSPDLISIWTVSSHSFHFLHPFSFCYLLPLSSWISESPLAFASSHQPLLPLFFLPKAASTLPSVSFLSRELKIPPPAHVPNIIPFYVSSSSS